MDSTHVVTQTPSTAQPEMPHIIIISITGNSTITTEATQLTTYAVKRAAALKALLQQT